MPRVKSRDTAGRRERSRCWIVQPVDEAPSQASVFRSGRLCGVGMMPEAVEGCLHGAHLREDDTS